jgi:hypothetical protein
MTCPPAVEPRRRLLPKDATRQTVQTKSRAAEQATRDLFLRGKAGNWHVGRNPRRPTATKLAKWARPPWAACRRLDAFVTGREAACEPNTGKVACATEVSAQDGQIRAAKLAKLAALEQGRVGWESGG